MPVIQARPVISGMTPSGVSSTRRPVKDEPITERVDEVLPDRELAAVVQLGHAGAGPGAAGGAVEVAGVDGDGAAVLADPDHVLAGGLGGRWGGSSIPAAIRRFACSGATLRPWAAASAIA